MGRPPGKMRCFRVHVSLRRSAYSRRVATINVSNGKFTVKDRDKVPTAGKTAARGRVDEALKKRKVRPHFEVVRRRKVVDSERNRRRRANEKLGEAERTAAYKASLAAAAREVVLRERALRRDMRAEFLEMRRIRGIRNYVDPGRFEQPQYQALALQNLARAKRGLLPVVPPVPSPEAVLRQWEHERRVKEMEAAEGAELLRRRGAILLERARAQEAVGREEERQRSMPNSQDSICEGCGGRGKIRFKPCKDCGGRGRVKGQVAGSSASGA